MVDLTLVPLVTKQTFVIGEATGISVSDITQDPADNYWVRRLMLFTDPISANNRAPCLDITLRAATKEVLEIQTPQLEF